MEKEEEFKVGDRVHHEIYGKGTIVELNYGHSDFLVEFDNENEQLNNGNGWGSNNYRDKHCWWCLPYQVTKLEQIVVKDIDGGERTYDIQVNLNERTTLEHYPEPDKPQEIKVKIGDKTIETDIMNLIKNLMSNLKK